MSSEINGIRTCISCRKKLEKKQLHRFLIFSDKILAVVEKQKVLGRSAYLCDNCIGHYNNSGSKEYQKTIAKLTYELTKLKKNDRK